LESRIPDIRAYNFNLKKEMKEILTNRKRLIITFSIVALMSISSVTWSQNEPSLQVGDRVPELRYGQWLKGTPFNKYEKGHLYLMEFWATWCGPCKAVMPHLSEVARERKDQLTVVGVNIFEGSHDSEKKPYDSYLPKVSRFVTNMGDNMAYNVIIDDNDEFMANNWMKAAGQSGIPCSFLIRDSIILWIGHPYVIDSIIQVVLDGGFDIKAERKKQEEDRVNEENSHGALFQKAFAAYEEKLKEEKIDSAIAILDAELVELYSWATAVSFFKFQTLLDHYGEAKAMEFLRQWQAQNPGYRLSVAGVISSKEGLTPSAYKYALQIINEELEKRPDMSPIFKNLMAGVYASAGNFKKAVKTQEAALNEASQAVKDNKLAGIIDPITIEEYREQLARYKEKLK
jgi:thiol-disulfide isomerase/thioredoxin